MVDTAGPASGRTLPLGAVTFLFTDIEGSTRLLEALGPRYRELLAAHHRIVREVVAANAGVEVGTHGDAFFCVFDAPSAAIRAAAAAQRSLAAHPFPGDAPVRVRMGVHSGDAVVSGGDYVGLDVHRAARIAAAAHGGQVLVSGATVELLPAGSGFRFRDLGQHRLRHISAPQRLYQLLVDGFPSAFPPPRAVQAAPPSYSPLLGRERELEQLQALLGATRLLTLTGPGGSGKTRLALELMAGVADGYPDGAHVVLLAQVEDPGRVPGVVAAALALREDPETTREETLALYLSSRRALLVLDNLEHLLPRVANTVAALLATAPGLSLVVTSRMPLRLREERELRLGPLEPGPAAELFVERATAAGAAFDGSDAERDTVREICRRLDGLPLAIELAAARTRLLGPAALLERLGQRLDMLTGGSRDLPERQQTLRGAIAWSHDLLGDEERVLFARLATFAGGATLDAAEEVCGAGLDALGLLVESSLLRRDDGRAGTPRIAMLETIREFAAERLAERGEAGELASRHLDWCVALAERGAAELLGSEQENWLRRLDDEADNLRRAFVTAFPSDPARACRLAAALGWYWYLQPGSEDAVAWLRAALEAGPGDPPIRGRLLFFAAAAAQDPVERLHLLEEARAPLARAGSPVWEARRLVSLGAATRLAGEAALARAHLEAARDAADAAGDPWSRWRSRLELGRLGAGVPAEAELALAAALELASAAGDPRAILVAGHALRSTVPPGDHERYEASLRDDLRLASELDAPGVIVSCLAQLAGLAAEAGDPAHAAALLGARIRLAAERQAQPWELEPIASPGETAVLESNAAAELGDDAYRVAAARGAALTLDAVVELALQPTAARRL